MNQLFAKLTAVGTRAQAGVYALRDESLDEESPLTEEGGSLILIAGDVFDADGR